MRTFAEILHGAGSTSAKSREDLKRRLNELAQEHEIISLSLTAEKDGYGYTYTAAVICKEGKSSGGKKQTERQEP